MALTGRQVVAEFFAAAARNDREAMNALLDPGIVVTEAESLPFGGRHVGIEAFRSLERRVFRCWRDTRVQVHELVGDGDCVVVLATMTGTARDGDGKLEMPMAEVWRLAGGRVVAIQPFYFDTRKFLDTLGTPT
jgi:ketosteroid isomerase-like protein